MLPDFPDQPSPSMTRRVRGVFFAVMLLVACFGILVFSSNPTYAQEFNCRVSVNYSTLTGSDFGFLSELQTRLDEYINKRSWTEDSYQVHERIECTIQINVLEAITLTSFKAQLIIASRRPIYNTMQHTQVVQFNDEDWQFTYVQGQSLIFNIERYDPLVSVIDFYIYVMLGYDYDTFSELGGTPYFERARRIKDLAQSRSALGWSQSQVGLEHGRSNLIVQILDPRMRSLRKAYFDYHFVGLDRFLIETDRARVAILDVLSTLNELFEDVATQYVIDLFFSTKSTELTAIFEGWPRSSEAYEYLTELDPSRTSEYDVLLN